MPKQVPSVGRVVHYAATAEIHLAADIAFVHNDDEVTLFVKDFRFSRTYFLSNVRYDPYGESGTFHWPEYVPSRDDTPIHPQPPLAA